jgi:hypothetical protein
MENRPCRVVAGPVAANFRGAHGLSTVVWQYWRSLKSTTMTATKASLELAVIVDA